MLRQRFSNARIEYVVEPAYREAVQGLASIDETLLYDRNRIKQSAFGTESLAFMRELRRRRYDVAIDFHGGPRSGLITRASGAPLRVGYTGLHGSMFYNRRTNRSLAGRRIHSVLQQIRLLEAIGICPEGRIPAVEMAEPGPAALVAAAGLLDSARRAGFAGIATIHVPPSNPFRNWGADRIARVADALSRSGCQPMFVGGPDGEAVLRQIQQSLTVPFVSLLGGTTALELKAVIAASRVFVGVDSGPMHVAATTGTPIVAVFGPNVPEISGPWTSRATIVQESLPCRPCDQRRCVFGDFRCFGRIGGDRVADAALRWLATDLSAPPPADLPADLYATHVSG